MRRSHSHIFAAALLVGIAGFTACGGGTATSESSASGPGATSGGGKGGEGQGGEGQGGAGGSDQGGAGQGGAGQGGAGGAGGMGGAGQGGEGGMGGAGGGSQPAVGENGSPCLTDQECEGGYCITEPGGGYPSGYCTEICTLAVGTCMFGGACLDVQVGMGLGACFDTCDPQGKDCRDPYACLTVVGGSSVCIPDCMSDQECPITKSCNVMSGFCEAPPGMTPTGQPCAGAFECASNNDDPYCISEQQGFPQGYCSEECNLMMDDCAGDAVCVDVNNGFALCLDGCVADADCQAPGYECAPLAPGVSVCLPTPEPESDCANLIDDDQDGLFDCQDPDCQAMPVCKAGMTATGLPCSMSSECAANMSDPFCVDEATYGWPAGYCSEYCDLMNDDCAGDAVCVDIGLPNGSGICFDGCMAQANCTTPGYACSTFGPMTKVCTASCTADAQCQGFCNPDNQLCNAATEMCGDMMDNDGDDATDCEDFTCVAGCQAQIAAACMGAVVAQAMNNGNTTGGSSILAGCVGGGAPERIFTYTAPQNGTLTVVLNSAADLGVYVRTTCSDKASQIACVDNVGGGAAEQFVMPVQAGVPLSIIVDGAVPGVAGAFSLSLTFAP